MQRVRMSLPYFRQFGWNPEVLCVDAKYADINEDSLLITSVPADIVIHKVKALPKKLTMKLGLGSIGLRSLWYYKKKGNRLLQDKQYDLIYFSTTQFPVCILGAYWKKRFDIPYVIDIQDPWHSDYYQDKPESERPAKYWFSYRINRYMEPIAVKNTSGLIGVSGKYITDLKERYSVIANIPAATIPFGAFEADLQIAADNSAKFSPLLKPGFKNIVYIGRGGNDMRQALTLLFAAIKEGLNKNFPLFHKLRFYFIGTSYAREGKGTPTIMPLAETFGITEYVVELTDRISYYHTLITLQAADALLIPGSDDPSYNPSKIYPYLLMQKPLLAIFNEASPAITILQEFGVKHVYNYDNATPYALNSFFENIANGEALAGPYDPAAVHKYSAAQMTLSQCELFDTVINGQN